MEGNNREEIGISERRFRRYNIKSRQKLPGGLNSDTSLDYQTLDTIKVERKRAILNFST